MILSLPSPSPSFTAAAIPYLTKKRNSIVTRTTSRLFLRSQNRRPDQDLIDAALARAKSAVQYDADGQVQLAVEAYAETIGLLCRVQQDPTPPLQRIHDVYADRIVALSTRESTEEVKHGHGEIAHWDLHHWTLLKKIKQSMIFGGHLTGRLHVPKELWHQPFISLPDLDKKLALAEYLLVCLKATRHHHPVKDPERTLQELRQLHQALLLDVHHEHQHHTLTHHPQTKKTLKWVRWSKKPVDRMRHIDDRYPMYIRTLIKVFSTAQFLDTWHQEYSDLIASALPGSPSIDTYQQVLHKISMCAETLGRVVCTTVMADFHLLWDAWVAKGNHYWMD